jgi:hypothetical protein
LCRWPNLFLLLMSPCYGFTLKKYSFSCLPGWLLFLHLILLFYFGICLSLFCVIQYTNFTFCQVVPSKTGKLWRMWYNKEWMEWYFRFGNMEDKCKLQHFQNFPTYVVSKLPTSWKTTVSRSRLISITKICVQGVHMKCILFICNTVHEMKGTGMKTKCIWVHCKIRFIIPSTAVSRVFHPKCQAPLTVVKMASHVLKKKVKCMLWFHICRVSWILSFQRNRWQGWG